MSESRPIENARGDERLTDLADDCRRYRITDLAVFVGRGSRQIVVGGESLQLQTLLGGDVSGFPVDHVTVPIESVVDPRMSAADSDSESILPLGLSTHNLREGLLALDLLWKLKPYSEIRADSNDEESLTDLRYAVVLGFQDAVEDVITRRTKLLEHQFEDLSFLHRLQAFDVLQDERLRMFIP